MLTVRYHGNLQKMTGCREEKASINNLKELFSHIRHKFGKDAELLARKCSILINGRNYIQLKRKERAFQAHDVIDIFPPVAGG